MLFFPSPLQQLPFSKVISDKDWMAQGKSSYGYFLRGYEALQTIVNAVHLTKVRPSRILDFGCGHGCVARMLAAQWPKSEIFGQDVNSEWLEWCESNLKIKGILSSEHIRSVSVERSAYDLIWVGSVFTHIPEDSFDYLLGELVSGLSNDGLLIFTTAGACVRETFDINAEKLLSPENAELAAEGFDKNGFGFAPYTGGTYPDWGRTMVSFDSVIHKLKAHPVRCVWFMEGGWGRRQDVYAVKRV